MDDFFKILKLTSRVLFLSLFFFLLACDSPFESASLDSPSCVENTIQSSLSDDEVLVGDMILPASDVYDESDLLKYWPDKIRSEEEEAINSAGVFTQAFRMWDDGILPIEYAPDVSNDLRNRIIIACAKISAVADVTCVERTNEEFYVRATTASAGCFATVGKSRGGVLNLEGDCRQETVIIHELMHNLGYVHEHQHPDRDNFVRVIEENISSGQESNFVKLSSNNGSASDLTLSDFDLDSIMLYFSTTFAVSSNRPSLVKRSNLCDAITISGFPSECIIPFNAELSRGDEEILAAVYGESSGEPVVTPTVPEDGGGSDGSGGSLICGSPL